MNIRVIARDTCIITHYGMNSVNESLYFGFNGVISFSEVMKEQKQTV